MQHEETLFNFMGVRRVTLARVDIHDREREIARRDNGRIAMLAGTASANETMLRTFVALDLGILERRPVRFLVFKPADIFS